VSKGKINDATLWSGEPVDAKAFPDVSRHIPEVREALNKEDYRLADKLNRNIQGRFSESFKHFENLFKRVLVWQRVLSEWYSFCFSAPQNSSAYLPFPF
jgi:hypothetical protein